MNERQESVVCHKSVTGDGAVKPNRWKSAIYWEYRDTPVKIYTSLSYWATWKCNKTRARIRLLSLHPFSTKATIRKFSHAQFVLCSKKFTTKLVQTDVVFSWLRFESLAWGMAYVRLLNNSVRATSAWEGSRMVRYMVFVDWLIHYERLFP